ncbi:MAG: DUF4920 domain-containing protein [Bacteroidia bacterium]
MNKLILFFFAAAFALSSCGGHDEKGKDAAANGPKDSITADGKVGFFGARITGEGATPIADFTKVATAENQKVKMQGKITGVCLGQGCWLSMETQGADGKPKDVVFHTEHKYAFPKDCKGKNVVVEGTTVKSEEGALEVNAVGAIISAE